MHESNTTQQLGRAEEVVPRDAAWEQDLRKSDIPIGTEIWMWADGSAPAHSDP
jgi:hypothetical protein